jgi:hypothetical protein
MMRALVVAGIIAAGVVGAISFAPADSASAGGNNTMTVDLDAGTAGIQSTRSVASGANVTIAIVASGIATPYAGYAWELEWDDNNLNFVSNTENQAGHGGTLCAPATATTDGLMGVPAGKEWAGQGAGCVRPTGTTSFAGDLVTIDVQCQTDGDTPVDLVTETADPAFFASFQAEGGVILPTSFVNATLTCGAGGPTDTPTTAPTATNTPQVVNTPTQGPCVGAGCNLPPPFTRTNTPVATDTPGGAATPVPGQPTTAPPTGANPTATRTGGGAGVIGGPDTGDGPGGGGGGSTLLLALLASGAGLTLVATGGWKLRGRAARNR